MKKLSELVKSALDDASTKIASAQDVTAQERRTQETPTQKVASAAPVPTAGSEKRASVIETAKLAMQFADSLDNLALVIPKLASPMAAATGPAATESPDKGKTKHTPTHASTLSSAEASHGGGGGNAKGQVANDGSVGGVPNAFSKKAAEDMLLAKIAQSNALLAVGQAKEAAALAKTAQAEFERMKKAYEEEDSSTRTPKGSPKSLETHASGMTGAPGGVAPDNKGMATMTQRDAKKREIAPIAEHVREPAFSARTDRGIQDNFEHTTGAKIASMLDKIKARKTA